MDEKLIERTVSEERVFEGRLVKVNRLGVTLPNGEEAMREVVRHVGASAVVPVDQNGRVMMVRQYRVASGRVMLEIPAGKLDSRDEDRLLAAQRELREETGLTAEKWIHLTDILTSPGFCDERISIYLALDLKKGETDPDEDEFVDGVSYSLHELTDMIGRGEIADAKTIIGLMMAEKYLNGQNDAE